MNLRPEIASPLAAIATAVVFLASSCAAGLAAGLSDPQNFLERGYTAFSQMKGVTEFLGTIVSRETALLEAWPAAEQAGR